MTGRGRGDGHRATLAAHASRHKSTSRHTSRQVDNVDNDRQGIHMVTINLESTTVDNGRQGVDNTSTIHGRQLVDNGRQGRQVVDKVDKVDKQGSRNLWAAFFDITNGA